MRTLTNSLWRPVCGLLMTLICLTPLRAEDKVPAEQVLPTQTMLMISVPDTTELKARFDETIWSDIFTNPEMQGLWSALSKQAVEGLEELKQETGIDYRDLMKIPAGEMTVSVTRVSRGKIGVTFSVEYGERKAEIEELLEKVYQQLEDAGRTLEVKELEDTAVTQVPLSKNEAAEEAADGQHVCWFQKDGYFVVSNQLRALEAILLRWDGENTDVLAEKEEFKYIRERCSAEGTEPAAYWYVDPLLTFSSILEAAPASAGSPMGPAMVQAFLPILGLDKLKAVGGSLDLATERYEEVTQTVIYAERPQTGILKMFHANEVAISPPDWVSGEAESFMIYHWGLEDAFKALRALVDGMPWSQPGVFDQQLDELADNPLALGLHPKKDFVDLMTGTLVVEVTPPPSGDTEDPVTLFALELKDSQKMSDVLAKIQKSEGGGVETRDFQGTIIYEVPLAGPAGLNMVVSQNYLFLSASPQRIEQIVRGGDSYPRLKDAQVFEQLAAEAPESAALWGMEQIGNQLERLTQQISGLMANLPAAEGDDAGAREILENFPSAKVLKKYASNTFFYVTTDERGVYWKSYSLRVKEQ